jgi:hypothetical protein
MAFVEITGSEYTDSRLHYVDRALRTFTCCRRKELNPDPNLSLTAGSPPWNLTKRTEHE